MPSNANCRCNQCRVAEVFFWKWFLWSTSWLNGLRALRTVVYYCDNDRKTNIFGLYFNMSYFQTCGGGILQRIVLILSPQPGMWYVYQIMCVKKTQKNILNFVHSLIVLLVLYFFRFSEYRKAVLTIWWIFFWFKVDSGFKFITLPKTLVWSGIHKKIKLGYQWS